MFCSNFFRLFSLYFSVFEASTYLQAQRFFPQPIKGILYFCYSFFFFWARAFLFIFRISICLLTLPAYSCMLSTFYIRAPSVWMVVVLLIDSQCCKAIILQLKIIFLKCFLEIYHRVQVSWALASLLGLPRWLSGKESSCQCRRGEFNPWAGKIPGKGNDYPL